MQCERLSDSTVARLVEGYFDAADRKPWSRFGSFDFKAVDPGKLTPEQRSAVRFVTVIEDHLPGYFAEYLRRFPVDGTVGVDDYAHNRELYHFTVRWAQEEDAHAHVLFTYQVQAGIAEADALRRALAEEGQKRFTLDFERPIQVFTYTFLQEKATQIYYQMLARAVDEPVLAAILTQLARDEARHFAFFSQVLEAYLRAHGPALHPAMQDVLQRFKMPLAETIQRYWRWSLEVADAAGGYDHTEAYDFLLRLMKRTADAGKHAKSHDVEDLVRAVRDL